jgi:hypothetical protein
MLNKNFAHKGRQAFTFREFAQILCETHAEKERIAGFCPSLFQATASRKSLQFSHKNRGNKKVQS